MTTPRIYLPQKMEEGSTVELRYENLHYIKNVLRLKRGNPLILFDGMGFEYESTIRDITVKSATVEIIRKNPFQVDNSIKITLAQALPKGNKMDFIIQKASELGVTRIIPFKSSRSIPKLAGNKIHLKMPRWQKIAVEASRKCGRENIPEITDIITYEKALQWPKEGILKIIFWEGETNTGIKEILHSKKYEGVTDFFIVVGPEGGFSNEEIEMASKVGFLPASLGRLVLKVETAVLVILSILQYEKGAFGNQNIKTENLTTK
ncbi:MAG: 16S rRNA (uracil(1498)-N(3))-methyltransferase [Syntrophales bacterium]|nr:16S rRNA (uracil(1498)-N(3))-methyltransferase [Syntrophales bacterium]